MHILLNLGVKSLLTARKVAQRYNLSPQKSWNSFKMTISKCFEILAFFIFKELQKHGKLRKEKIKENSKIMT